MITDGVNQNLFLSIITLLSKVLLQTPLGATKLPQIVVGCK